MLHLVSIRKSWFSSPYSQILKTETKKHQPRQKTIDLLSYYLSCLQNMLEQWWHKACGINQPMSYLTQRPRVKPNTMGLKKKNVSIKWLLTTLCITIDQCLSQPSAQKLPPVADGNKYRDPHSDITQRDSGTYSSECDVSIKLFPSVRLVDEESGKM